MKFLLDQDVYAATSLFLKSLGHDIVSVAEIGHSRSADVGLLHIAHEQERIFVTRDRDFGQLVFVADLKAGIIYLRVLPSTLQACTRNLRQS
jgi:predicted nuclease of predicted toxin-antitoxin system